MPKRFKVTIDCVDGETFYVVGGTARQCLAFLDFYDHEGSSITGEDCSSTPAVDLGNPDEIYQKLLEAGPK